MATTMKGEGTYGYNVATEVYEDLYAAGVIDQTEVTRMALQNAASIAGPLLTVECSIADQEKTSVGGAR